jgi:glyoxylase I family protein
MLIHSVHHIAIICSNYQVSKHFYTHILGLSIIKETYRAERKSYKLDMALHGQYIIELFSFENPPVRPSQPEASGLRHIAFAVENVPTIIKYLLTHNIAAEPIRVDGNTNKQFTFIADPDGLPIEFYQK